MNLKQAGISLVETLVGLSIAAGISVVLMRQQETSSKMQSKNNANQVIISAANVIQTALANQSSCTLSLNGKGVGDFVTQIVEGKLTLQIMQIFWPRVKSLQITLRFYPVTLKWIVCKSSTIQVRTF